MDSKKMMELEALSESLGNVLEACGRMGISRSLFYRWLGRERGDGEKGKGKGKRRRHPQATSESVVKRVLEVAGEFPEWGCDRISHYLSLHKQHVGPTTVQKILARNGLGTMADRQCAR